MMAWKLAENRGIRMKKKIVIWGTLFIILQLIKSLLLGDYKASYGTSRIEILVNKESVSSGRTAVSTKMERDYQVAKSSCKEGLLVENNQADVTAINIYWHQVQRPQMLEGAFWGEEADEEGRNLAVISDTLAVKLWGSEKALGNMIHIQDQVYQVSGVYKRYKNIRQYQLDDGKEKIYIPLKSSLSCEWPIQFMVIDGTKQEALPGEKDLFSMGIDSSNYTISHREKWFKSQKSLVQLPIMLIWFLLLSLMIKLVKKVIKNHEKTWKKKMIIIGGMMILMLILLRACMRGIYIDISQLPSENIFDLTFYWKGLLKEWSGHNQLIRYPSSQFERAYYLLKYWNYFINFLQILIEVKIIVETKLFMDRTTRVNQSSIS